MNQVLKNSVYRKGTQRHINFMADLGGMNQEERDVFQLLHEGYSDLDIQTEKCMSKSAYESVEEQVRSKLLLAVFDCINERMRS